MHSCHLLCIMVLLFEDSRGLRLICISQCELQCFACEDSCLSELSFLPHWRLNSEQGIMNLDKECVRKEERFWSNRAEVNLIGSRRKKERARVGSAFFLVLFSSRNEQPLFFLPNHIHLGSHQPSNAFKTYNMAP